NADPVPGKGGHHHADEPEPQLSPHQAKLNERPAGEMRPEIVGNGEIHNNDGAAEYQVEMTGDPLRIMNRGVERVGHVDDAARAAKAEHDERESDGEHDRIVPRQCPHPTEHTLAAA